MIVIGVLLLVVVIAVVAFVVLTGSGHTTSLSWEWGNFLWEPTPAILFGAGALTLAVLALSLLLIRSGVRRGVHKNQEMRRLRKLEHGSGRSRPAEPAPVSEGASVTDTRRVSTQKVTDRPGHGSDVEPHPAADRSDTPVDLRSNDPWPAEPRSAGTDSPESGSRRPGGHS